jgi:SAM-dependent methyltransferase
VARPREEGAVRGFDASTYGERFADVYDDWYADVSDVGATVAAVAALAEGGSVLELGIGTGRLALPLAERGVEVWGVDASPAMLDRLRAKPGARAVRAVVGDFARLDAVAGLPDRVTVVLVAFNTFFNIPEEAGQRRCLAAVARLLGPGGRLVLEAFVPDVDADGPRGDVAPAVVEADRVVLHVSRLDPAAQTVAGQHVTITADGIRLRPWYIRYATPDQLDAMAADAGLVLLERWGDWDGRPFGPGDDRHVSVYGVA